MSEESVAGRAAVDRLSPNWDERPAAAGPVDTLVLHYTGMVSAEAALARMTDAPARVSAHWCIGEDGTLWRLVPEERRAWHAGVSEWRGRRSVNDFSIGIELVNPGHEHGYRPFPQAQMDALLDLARAIVARHPIDPRNVVAHSDIAPTRRQDPGELFDWARLARAGIGVWPEDAAAPLQEGPSLRRGDRGAAVRLHQARLREVGYGIVADGDFGAATAAVVRAFQRHFRQARVDGVIDAGTAAVIGEVHALALGQS
ncbi:MAG: N-acetylmuramoyl-L-alanine amidase [Rhodospirillales bacterium]|nr:N-acetylmuramoyl-L-alanine amidase [Rhodospirillales bacterium]